MTEYTSEATASVLAVIAKSVTTNHAAGFICGNQPASSAFAPVKDKKTVVCKKRNV